MVRRNNNRSKQKRKLSRKMRGGAVTKSNMPVCQLIYNNKIYHADNLRELFEFVDYPGPPKVAGEVAATEPAPAPATAPTRDWRSERASVEKAAEERRGKGPSGLRDY